MAWAADVCRVPQQRTLHKKSQVAIAVRQQLGRKTILASLETLRLLAVRITSHQSPSQETDNAVSCKRKIMLRKLKIDVWAALAQPC